MAEKLYRIKPLVWKGNRAETGAAVGYEIHLRDASISKFAVVRRTWESWGQPKTEELKAAFSLEDCKIKAQRDYESRLIASGVIEPVENPR